MRHYGQITHDRSQPRFDDVARAYGGADAGGIVGSNGLIVAVLLGLMIWGQKNA